MLSRHYIVDWLTIPGAKISDLELAWNIDYRYQTHPMRVLLVAGLNDLIKGGTKDTVMESIRQFQKTIDDQNRYHNGARNQFVVANLLNPPKLAWHKDNHPPPHGYINRLEELIQLNQEIDRFNTDNGMFTGPGFQNLGVRKTKIWHSDGSWSDFKAHRWQEWRRTEPDHDKLHLNDRLRMRMGRMVVRYFEGEMEREAGAISVY